MTLVLTIQGREAIWLLADRRLSYRGRAPRDDGRKVMCLETRDGVSIIGYAGLGATALGTEPADWMVSVLRGRDIPLEKTIEALAGAMQREFPPHLSRGGHPHAVFEHVALIPAIVENQARLYTIGLRYQSDGGNVRVSPHRQMAMASLQHSPRIAIAGSGQAYLTRNRSWERPLLNVVRNYDIGKVNARTVADHLARLNEEVHRGTLDGTVGPRCVVIWRNRTGGVHKGGGGHQFYTSGGRERQKPTIPSILRGMDGEAIFKALMPHMKGHLSAALKGSSTPIDEVQINEDLSKLPDKPDERLR